MSAFSATEKHLGALVPVLRKRWEERQTFSSEVQAREGAAHVNHGQLTLYEQEQA